jgi:hypothetical protein
MAVLRNGSKCSHTTCMLRFFTVSRLALNSNLIFEIGSNNNVINLSVPLRSLTYPYQKIFTIGTVFKFPYLFYALSNNMKGHQEHQYEACVACQIHIIYQIK